MKKMLLAFGMVLFLNIQPAHSEIYQYKDKNGNTIFTDDMTKVPENLREGIKSYDEVRSSIEPPTDDSVSSQVPPANPPASDPDAEKNRDLETKKKELDEKSKAFSDEANVLNEDRKALEESSKNLKTKEEKEAYREKLKEFNKRADDYNKRKQEIDADISSYNQEIGAANDAKIEADKSQDINQIPEEPVKEKRSKKNKPKHEEDVKPEEEGVKPETDLEKKP